MIKLSSARNVTVNADRAVLLVDANPKRKVLNVTGGAFDVWLGQRDVLPNTEQNKLPAGTRGVYTNIQSEIWVIASGGNTGKISYSEEVEV